MQVTAGRDINLTTAQENHALTVDQTRKKSGFLSSKTTTTHDAYSDSYAIGTVLSGETVQVAAGRDVAAYAAQIVGTNEVVLAAGNNLTLGVGEDTHSESHDKRVKQSGLFGSGGASITLGASTVDQGATVTQATPQGSLVGSTDGNVILTAGNDVHITGSDVISQTGTAIVGRNVTIEAALGTTDTGETYKQKQAGVNIGLTGGVVDAALAVYGATRRSGEVEDGRLKALYAAKTAYAVKDGVDAAQAAAQAGSNLGGASLRIGLGASSASSTTDTHGETAYGSRVQSQGDVTIAATEGNLNVIGSQISGDNVGLAAAQDLNLLSQAEQHTLESRNKNGGAEIGVSVGTTTGIYLSAYAGKGKADGNGTSHAETVVTARDTLALTSGNDTTLQGAQATGERVLGSIGGDLHIQSEQDTDDYASRQQQAGVTLVYGWSGSSGSYSQQKTDSHYASVAEQSGIQAGGGGFDIDVGGGTTLVGGAIASTADAADNRLSTASLMASDLRNGADYQASSLGASGGVGSGGGLSPALAPGQSDAAHSTTKAGISAGEIEIRGGDATALASLDRNVTGLQQEGIKPIFDQRKVAEGMEFAEGLGAVATRIVDQIYERKLQDKQEQIDAVQAAVDQEAANGNPEVANQLREQVVLMRQDRDAGHDQTIAQSIAGVAVAALAGNVSLGDGLTYAATNSAVARWDEDANKAMRGHDETATMKVTCTLSAQVCADLRMPDGLDAEQRLDWLRGHGMTIEFIDQIPENAANITVNGIINDAARGGHVEVGHVSMNDKDANNVTFYVQYNATKGALSDLMQAGYDKFISPLNGDYSATTTALVEAVRLQGEAGTSLAAHSWGTIVTRNVLNLLDDQGYRNSNLYVAAFGPAVRPGALVDPMTNIVGGENVFPTVEGGEEPHLLFLSNPTDPVSGWVGGNTFPSKYTDNNSPEYLPGASRSEVLGSLLGFYPVFMGPENPHSCYGLNCAGTIYNWTAEKAAAWKKKPEVPAPGATP